MHYVLNFFDTDRQPSHCVHMNCADDRGAIALVDLVSQKHEMELCQGQRIVRGYRGKPLPLNGSPPIAAKHHLFAIETEKA